MQVRVQEALAKLQDERWPPLQNYLSSVDRYLREITEESARVQAALLHNWHGAAQHCTTHISRLLDDLSCVLPRSRQFLDRRQKEIPRLSLLFEELMQLHQEFGSIQYQSKENTLSVETDPIELDGIYLGPFRIQLCLDKVKDINTDSPYYCFALEPNPATTNEDVTHPHVSREKLCEGDGSVAIRTAIEEGRLCDFFTMVRSILSTYNADSAYVSMEDWEGEPCYDCGSVTDSESRYYCSFCDRDYCQDCSSCCQSCDEITCLGCGGQCSHCEDFVCPNCISKCSECESLCCKNCLEENLCPNCKQELENENEERESEIDNQPANQGDHEPAGSKSGPGQEQETSAEIQPNSLGQAAVLQG